MTRRWITTTWTTSAALAWGVALLGAACASSVEPTAHDPSSVAPATLEPEPPPSSEPVPSSEPAPASEEPPFAEPAPAVAASASGEARASSGEPMTDFFGIGRGDRIADLGGVSGYSLMPVRRVLGPAGVVYVRRASPPPSEPAAASAADDLAKLVWMNTSEEAPFTAEATRLNAVTLLFGYHALVAAGRDRKKLNAAVYAALVPGGLYVIADRAAPPGSGLGAARQLNAIEDTLVRLEVQASGFEFVEGADFVSNAAGASARAPGSQFVLKFRKPE